MEGLKKMGEKRLFKYPFTHGGTDTSKCGTGTKSVLPVFFVIGTVTSKCDIGTTLLLPLFP